MAGGRFARHLASGMRHALRLMGSSATVIKADDNTTVTGVLLAIGTPNVGGTRKVSELTPGLAQTTKQCKVLISEWDAKVGRPPRRGDQIIILGRRYGVLGPTAEGVSEQNIVYVIDVTG